MALARALLRSPPTAMVGVTHGLQSVLPRLPGFPDETRDGRGPGTAP